MVTETFYREEAVEKSSSYNKILQSDQNKLLSYEKLEISEKEASISLDNEKKQKRKSDILNPNSIKRTKSETDSVDLTSDEVFSWQAYLKKTNSTAVPSTIFKHIIPECICGFQPGMKLEVPNKDYLNTYWLAYVIRKAAPLILVRYEGFDDSKADFWLNTLSDDIHPVGWCARNKQVLKPPKAIQHKETNWYQYLIKHLTGARKAAEHLFHKKSHPAHYLRAGQYVEVLDFFNPTCYWLARICETFSGRLSLQYEGFFDKEGELWCFYLSPNLRPVGHGLSHGLTLYPPKGCQSLTQPQLNKVIEKLLVLSNRTDNSVFKTLFKGLENLTPHGVFLGMKLEAIHPHDPSSICVASVSRIFDSYMFLVKIDNLISAQDEITDSFVAYRGSKKIFPVGFCSKNNISLIQPLGYNGKFTWEAYFKYTKSVSVPSDFFQESSLPENIEVGMKLEAVDQENLSNICVCTVSKVVGTHLWLNIDGDTRTDQIFSYDSHELFPVGWCEKTGHELQWPRPNTLEQKNRISSLRLTATRQTRLEVLRKGKYKVSEGKTETKKDQKHKGKSQNYLKGKRGFSRKRVNYDSDGNKSEIVDTSIAIVCINRLADEYNSEASIKKHFHLDSEGRLPAQVVTIDDDEEDDPITNDKLAAVSNFNESQLSFFSFIRLKPLKLNKKEEEEFNKKIKENDANQGTSSEELSPLRGMERRSLNNVVAMLRANRRSNRSQLIENYKCNKSKDEHQSSNQKKPSRIIESLEKEIPDEKEATSIDLPKNNKRCDQPNSVVTPSKESLESLSKEDVANKTQVAEQIAGVARSSSVSSTPRTNIEDMHMLSNMARSHSGLNEILRNRCNKIRMLCKDLPNNPLLWTKGEVAQFIKNASFQKYANLFYQQDVDGHSLLLLTVQEIHHILGIQLGPALKIHDYIFTLQELVNDAYLSNESQGGASKLTTVNNSSVVWDQARKIRDMSLPNNEAHSTHLEVVRWLNKSHEESASFSSPDVDEDILTVANKVASARGYQPRNFQISRPRFIQIKDVKSLGPRHPLRPQVRLLQPPQLIPEFSSGSAMNVKHIPEKKDDTQVISVQKSDHNRLPTMEISKKDLHSFSFQSYHNNLNLMPYLSNTAASSSSLSSKSCDYSEINFQERPNNVHMFKNILHVPQNLKRTFEKKLTSKPTEEPPLKIVKNKHLVSCASFTDMSNTSVNVQTPSKNLPPLTSGTIPLTSFPSEHPWFDKYLKNVQVELEGKELWEEFNELGTEMILTRAGRRMFPNLQVRISGMHPKALYVILVDFAPVDHHRYKFEYETSRWMIACEEFTPRPSRVYGHSDSPACGEIWMKNLVDFTKCKLTNNVHDDQGHILMHSMHKYQPRIHVLYWEGTLSLNIDPFELLRISCHKVFIFPETKFIAVTAYQNSQITQLKIAQNPFARGFRGDWRKAAEVALVEVDQMKGNLLETFKYSTFSKENIFSHLNYKTKSPNEENTDAIVKHQTPKNAKNPQSSAGLITKTNIVHNIKEVKSVTPPIFSVKNEDIEKEAPTLVASQITDSNEISLKKEPV